MLSTMQSYGVSLLVLAGGMVVLAAVVVGAALIAWGLDFVDRIRDRFTARRERRAYLKGIVSR